MKESKKIAFMFILMIFFVRK